jgi:hypothetical protein
METPHWAVIKDGYVIDVVLWDPEQQPDWKYPHPHDQLVLDEQQRVMIGDQYRQEEGRFYRIV